jgi:prophage regulatory protein
MINQINRPIEQSQNISSQFYRINQLTQMLSVSKSTIWYWVKKGAFPEPYSLGENVTGWRALDIQDWIESRSKFNKD